MDADVINILPPGNNFVESLFSWTRRNDHCTTILEANAGDGGRSGPLFQSGRCHAYDEVLEKPLRFFDA